MDTYMDARREAVTCLWRPYQPLQARREVTTLSEGASADHAHGLDARHEVTTDDGVP